MPRRSQLPLISWCLMLAIGLPLAGRVRADDADTAILPGVQALADALKDKDADVRKNAALSLGATAIKPCRPSRR